MAQAQLVPQFTSSPFVFKNHTIRTTIEEKQLWFVAKDVCSALEISWSGATLKGFPSNWRTMLKFNMVGRNRLVACISEPAVYKLAFRSNKPEADEFTNWVASEVLPAIRKTGKYEAGQIETLTPSTPDDRAPLRALVHAWSQVCGQSHSALWPQVKAHFQLSRIDDLPAEWLPDALAFVQSKMDSWPKALPEAASYLHYDFEQAVQVTSDIKVRANALGMNLYNEFKLMGEEARRSFWLSSEACVSGYFDFFLNECEQNMKRLANVVFEATLAYSSQAKALQRLAQLMQRN